MKRSSERGKQRLREAGERKGGREENEGNAMQEEKQSTPVNEFRIDRKTSTLTFENEMCAPRKQVKVPIGWKRRSDWPTDRGLVD